MSDYIVVSKSKLLKELQEYPNFKPMIIRMVESSIIDVDKDYQEKSNNKISIENSVISKISEEDIFWNKPKIVEFDSHLFVRDTCRSSYPNGFTQWDSSYMLKSEGRYLRRTSNTMFMAEQRNIYIDKLYYELSTIPNNLINISSIDVTKLFFEKYVKLLSKTYPTIKTYIIFWRYWIDTTVDKTKHDGCYYSDYDRYYLIPEKKLYSHLPFMKNYSKYLVTRGERKGYKIQMYAEYAILKDTMKYKVLTDIYENNQEYK